MRWACGGAPFSIACHERYASPYPATIGARGPRDENVDTYDRAFAHGDGAQLDRTVIDPRRAPDVL